MKLINDDQANIPEAYIQDLAQRYELDTFVIHASARLKDSSGKGKSILAKDTAAQSQYLYPSLVSDAIGCGMSLLASNFPVKAQVIDRFVDVLKHYSSYRVAQKTNINRIFNNPLTLRALGHAHSLPQTSIFESPYSIKPETWLRTLRGGVAGYLHDRGESSLAKECSTAFENGGAHLSKTSEDEFQAVLGWLHPSWLHGLISRNSDIASDTYFRGNHFLELQCVEEIYQPEIARRHHLSKDTLTMMMHTHGHGFSSLLQPAAFESYFANRTLKLSPDHDLFVHYFTLKNIMKTQSSIQRASMLLRLLDSVRCVDQDMASNLRFVPVVEATHNDVFQQNGSIIYVRDAHRLYADRLSIVAGDRDNVSYIVQGGPNMEKSLGTVCHGIGHTLEKAPDDRRAAWNHVLTRHNRFLLPLRLPPRYSLDKVQIRSDDFSDAVMERMEQRGTLRRVARLRPLLTLDYTRPYSQFEYFVYRILTRQKSASHY